LLLNEVFPIVDMCLSYEDIARQRHVRWCADGDFLRPVFSASRVQHISYMHSKFAQGHIMCRSMVDIQLATAEIRQRIKKKIEDINHRAKI